MENTNIKREKNAESMVKNASEGIFRNCNGNLREKSADIFCNKQMAKILKLINCPHCQCYHI